MSTALLIGFAAILVAVVLFVLALWQHKRSSAGEVKLLAQPGRVETKLEPEGTVMVAGELWRAKSNDGAHIDVGARVRIVGMQGHLVLVEPCQNPDSSG